MILDAQQKIKLVNLLLKAPEEIISDSDTIGESWNLRFTNRQTYGVEDITFVWKSLSFRTFQHPEFQQVNFTDEEGGATIQPGFERLRAVIESLVGKAEVDDAKGK